MNMSPGNLARARGRDWVIQSGSSEDLLCLRPLTGSDDEVVYIVPSLEREPVRDAVFPLPDPDGLGNMEEGSLFRTSAMLRLRNGTGPLRCMGNIAVEPRSYQLTPLLMALRLDTVRMLIADDVGIGKTIEACLIAKELMDSCHSVVYLTAFQLFELLSQAAFGRDRQGQSGRQAYPYIFDCDLLIIDDLGTELPNSFTVSQLFLCVNERILRKKSTLISSNLDMEALRNIYSERTLSRIISCYTIRQLPGSDIRIRKKLNAGSPGEI